MKISYAVCVCNESRDLYSLIAFLKKVKDPEDEINVLVDTAHVTNQVKKVLDHFKSDIVTCERDFDGKFATHRNYHFEQCTGDYIFTIDPDEMPHEMLIKNLKNILVETGADFLWIPRINICPGYTEDWLKKCKFTVNECGWINWPDYQGRVIKRSSEIRWAGELHEKIEGAVRVDSLQANPELSLWHIKSVEKQDARWDEHTFEYVSPSTNNPSLYDQLL